MSEDSKEVPVDDKGDASVSTTLIGTKDISGGSENNKIVSNVEPIDTRCGLGSCKPPWLQVLARKEMYAIVYSLSGFIMGMFFTYSTAVLSTVEKRFKFTSKQTGFILSGNDVSQALLAVVLSYYGNYGHRPHWMGIGTYFAAASCILAALPHFIYGSGDEAANMVRVTGSSSFMLNVVTDDVKLNVTEATNLSSTLTKAEEMCYSSLGNQTCSATSEALAESYLGPAIMFFVAQFFVGIGISIIFSVGVTYMDDNINKKSSPLYVTLSMLTRVLGPVFGFFLGSRCLNMWVNPSISPNLSTRDPRWLGAWWLGYIVIGLCQVVTGFFFFFFPRKLPLTVIREESKIKKAAEKEEKTGTGRGIAYFTSLAESKRNEHQPSMRNLPKALKRLFTNKIWVANTFNTVVYLLAVSGYWNFKPKYIENQFRKSASEANLYTGMASLIATVMGMLISGAILRWCRPRPRLVTGYNIILTLLEASSYIILIFVGCPKLDIIGPQKGLMDPVCSSNCGCSLRFSPVCAENGSTTFYSPCFAGCMASNQSTNPTVYSNCSCIYNTMGNATFNSTQLLLPTESESIFGGSAKRGYCDESCNAFVIYLVIQVVSKMIFSTGRISSTLILLRSVADEDKGIAMGTLTVFISLFSFIPAPIIMGAIVDSACLVWEESCGGRGNCWFYDSDKFRVLLHTFPAVMVFVSVLGDIVIFYYSVNLELYGEEDEVEMEKKIGDLSEVRPLNSAGTEIKVLL